MQLLRLRYRKSVQALLEAHHVSTAKIDYD